MMLFAAASPVMPPTFWPPVMLPVFQQFSMVPKLPPATPPMASPEAELTVAEVPQPRITPLLPPAIPPPYSSVTLICPPSTKQFSMVP